MGRISQTWTISIIIFLSVTVHIASLWASKTFMFGVLIAHEPLHAVVEVLGSIIALMVAWFLLLQEDQKTGTNFNVWIAGALISMGVLDAFHAVVHVGHTFVWLHSAATFIGSVFFCFILLPKKWQQEVRNFWPRFTLLFSILFGTISLMFADLIPPMLDLSLIHI